jgi:hypothetical protein
MDLQKPLILLFKTSRALALFVVPFNSTLYSGFTLDIKDASVVVICVNDFDATYLHTRSCLLLCP